MVIEEAVVLRKLHCTEIVLGNHLGAKHIEPAEKPAASGASLVGNPLGVYLVRKLGIKLRHRLVVERKDFNVVGGYCIIQRLVSTLRLIAVLKLLQHLGSNVFLCRSRHHRQCANCRNNKRFCRHCVW